MTEPSNATLTIGRYALCAEIASGGMASVHFARLLGHGGFSRLVAAKRLLPHMVTDVAFTAMLMDEARLASRIRHPNVVSTLDVVADDAELVVVMEYVHGESLSRLADTANALGEPISLALASSIVIDALHGLHAAHEATDESGQRLGVVHRDISPQNLLVGVDGVTRIADFGIAKAAGRSHQTRDGTIKGKLSYMAPEQIERGELTAATDVFAISIVLWELLTNRQLFEGATDVEIMRSVLTYEVPAPSSLVAGIPAEYDRVVERGLSRDLTQRFGSAREMALALEAISTPVRASDVGAWVGRIASETLQLRESLIASIERASTAGEDIAFATTKPVTPTPSAVQKAPTNTASLSWAAGTPRRSPSWLPLIALVALLLGGFCAAMVIRRARPPSPAAASGASPSRALSTVVPAGKAPPVVTSAMHAQATSSAAPPAAAGVVGATSKSAAVRHDKAKAPADCGTPYFVDSSGRRIFKMECM